MKQFFFTTLLVSLAIYTFAQQRSLGVSFSAAKGFLKSTEYAQLDITPTVPDVEVTYIRYEREKISWKTGLGISLHTFHSAYNEDGIDMPHLDQVMHLTIPYHLNFHPKKWFYIGFGINTNLKMQSITFPVYDNQQAGPAEENMMTVGRSVLIEGLANAGIEYNIGKIKFRLGSFLELPFNNREYFNIGSEVSLLYTLADKDDE